MKKLLITALLATTITNAQYAKSSFSIESGFSKLENITPVKYGNVHWGYRYMFNTKIGARTGVGATGIEEMSIYEGYLQGVVNVGRVLEFESFASNTTLLAFGGAAMTDTKDHTQEIIVFRRNHFNPVMGFRIEQKLTKGLFLSIGSNLMVGVNSVRNDIGVTGTTNKWEFNIALTAPVLRGKHKDHADFYIPEPMITSRDTTIIENHYHEVTKMFEKPFTGYVQFAYDSDRFEKGSQALAVIKEAAESLKPNQTLLLICYASPENGTGNPNYNDELALRRGETVRSIAISHGVKPDDIEIDVVGAFPTEDGNNIELSRSVKIQVLDENTIYIKDVELKEND